MNNLILNKKTKLSFLFLTAFFASLGIANETMANNNDVGFFENGKLQEMIQKPFFLYYANKDESIPFYAGDYISWEYFFVEDSKHFSEAENPFLCSIENKSASFCELTKTFEKKTNIKKITRVFIEEEKTKKYLQSLSEKINSAPKNGRLEVNEQGELFFSEDGKEGYSLDVDGSYEEILNVLKNKKNDYYILLATNKTEPELSKNNLNKLGIKEKIGTGESNFRGSTVNRIHNVKVAATKFHGLLIKPDEEFSFIENLGEVDDTTGYKKELVIKQNTTVPEFGGGVCQVSTTAFRVALNTGLKITERHNHAYPVSYYNPPGSDATVYIPSPDLKFINDTGHHILIQTKVEGTKLFFDFYGTSDGRQVEIDGPKITEKTPEGKIRTVLYQKIKDKEGKEIREDVFKSFYDNHDNYPNPNDVLREKPKDWSSKQWEEYYAKYGSVIEQLKNKNP